MAFNDMINALRLSRKAEEEVASDFRKLEAQGIVTGYLGQRGGMFSTIYELTPKGRKML